jgi:hypothetical protein
LLRNSLAIIAKIFGPSGQVSLDVKAKKYFFASSPAWPQSVAARNFVGLLTELHFIADKN